MTQIWRQHFDKSKNYMHPGYLVENAYFWGRRAV